jgi:hypothetical protein
MVTKMVNGIFPIVGAGSEEIKNGEMIAFSELRLRA